MPKKIFIVAVEPSADLHGHHLIKAILDKSPDTKFIGTGGELMRSAGCKLFYNIKNMSVLGFTEVIKKLPLYKKIFKELSEKLDSEKPDAVILIDYPGFNLRFAKEAKKRNIPVIYYISPQIWAWDKGRIKTIKNTVDKMLVLFEFEKDLYQQNGIDAFFTGHPLVDSAKPSMPKENAIKLLNLDPAKKTIALLPGSRQTEVKKVLPIMLKSVELIAKNLPNVQFVLIKSPIIDKSFYEKIISISIWGHPAGTACKNTKVSPQSVPTLTLIDKNRYDAVNIADFALVASGTATLETAMLGVPMVLIYKVNLLTYMLARILIRIPYIGLVNVVAGEKIIDEFIQFNARAKNIAAECLNILKSPAKISKIKLALASVKEKLGPPGASANAANEILKFLNTNHANTKTVR